MHWHWAWVSKASILSPNVHFCWGSPLVVSRMGRYTHAGLTIRRCYLPFLHWTHSCLLSCCWTNHVWAPTSHSPAERFCCPFQKPPVKQQKHCKLLALLWVSPQLSDLQRWRLTFLSTNLQLNVGSVWKGLWLQCWKQHMRTFCSIRQLLDQKLEMPEWSHHSRQICRATTLYSHTVWERFLQQTFFRSSTSSWSRFLSSSASEVLFEDPYRSNIDYSV